MPQLAKRFETLPEYVLARIPQKKHELLKRGVDVINLGAGDADLMPPEAATRYWARGRAVTSCCGSRAACWPR